MARQKKDSVRMTLNCDRQVAEMLDRYAEYKGQTRTVAMERILSAYLTQFFEELDGKKGDDKEKSEKKKYEQIKMKIDV